MNKFKKRIQKSIPKRFNAVVYETGFGHLEDILDLFFNVFVISNHKPLKHKKLIYRELDTDLSSIVDVTVIFIDRNKVDNIPFLLPIIQRHRPQVIIEGNDSIERIHSTPLYEQRYRLEATQGFYHRWKIR